jgi:D-serine deaminase-like pyridoxal phosphate-dependent protein
MDRWYQVSNVAEVDSPALLFYPERIEENIRRMVAMVGQRERLRPHIKTHKTGEIVRLQLAQGINKCKCATIAEAEMAAQCGVADVLIAYQPVGPKVVRIARLMKAFPKTRFSVIADDETVLQSLPSDFEVLLDIDMGQHRTGIEPGPAAVKLYRSRPGGVHIYDGHLQQPEVAERKKAWDAAFEAARQFLKEIGPVPRIVGGGTPTFAFWARETNFECSPGTSFLWDHSYGTKLRDLDFLPAALVLTRVVSKPGANRLCLDLGHKAIGPENPPPRVHLLELPNAKPVGHSEEHMVIETERAGEFAVGDCLYGIPFHVCPTVALHGSATVVRNGAACGVWEITARDRKLTI